MTLARICQREVDLASPTETVQTAGQRMDARNVGTLVIVDAGQRPIGILTDRDLALRVVAAGLDPASTPVGDVMTVQPRTVSEQAPVEDALALMRSRGVRRIPVVAPDGRLVGLVSVDDVLALLAEEFRQLGRLLEKTSPRSLAVT